MEEMMHQWISHHQDRLLRRTVNPSLDRTWEAVKTSRRQSSSLAVWQSGSLAVGAVGQSGSLAVLVTFGGACSVTRKLLHSASVRYPWCFCLLHAPGVALGKDPALSQNQTADLGSSSSPLQSRVHNKKKVWESNRT
ncbi:hypothetical protein K432DRAFT_50568 [Lepidopterella palustris CBS 459.81]|uniref:Uncharacterized protein n=1 Tax=Lepidopterella palustris CBS 459.81 TaxID=1314670 RepID=A0A8E2JF25_9PEZI|nr:hypothetical protein K432DRAFT_50568 [Lepidopterella palustris CBS 459.81]